MTLGGVAKHGQAYPGAPSKESLSGIFASAHIDIKKKKTDKYNKNKNRNTHHYCANQSSHES